MYVTYHPLKECVELPDSFLSAIQTFSSSQFYTELLNLLSGVNSEYFYSTVTERYSKISLVPSYSPTFSIKSTYFDVFNFNTQELNKINHILETAAIFHSLLEKCTSTDTNLRDALAELFNDSISQYCLKEYIDALPKDPSLQELFEFSLIWRNRIDYFSHVYTTLYSELGLNILNNLYKEYTSKIETLWESQILKKILNSLFSRFFLQLKEWLLYGRIPNHNKDWIFCKREEIPDCRKWKELIYPKMKLFPISMKYIVNIFEDFLSIGKAQLFLQESNYQTKFKDNVNKMNDLLNEISDPTVFYEIRHRYHLCCTIRKMHDIANRYIIQQIFQDEHLMDHWKAIKSYMLLTDININKKIMNNIDNCIELTVDQIIFNFSKLVNSCDMIRKLRIKPSFNLYTYTNPHASQRNTSAFLIPNLNFITMEPLSVNFSSSLPISIIINEKTLNYLQKIFKLTLSLLAVYTSFEKIYLDIKEAFSCVRKFNNPQLENFPLYRLLIHFKRAYIIPKHTYDFENEVIKLESMDTIINRVYSFLKNLRYDLFMDEKSKIVFTSLLETLCFCNDFLYLFKNTLYRIICPEIILTPVEIVSLEREVGSFLSIFVTKLDHIADCVIKECPSSLMNTERKNFYSMIIQLVKIDHVY